MRRVKRRHVLGLGSALTDRFDDLSRSLRETAFASNCLWSLLLFIAIHIFLYPAYLLGQVDPTSINIQGRETCVHLSQGLLRVLLEDWGVGGLLIISLTREETALIADIQNDTMLFLVSS